MIPGQHDCRHSQDDSHLQLADIYQATVSGGLGSNLVSVIVMKVISPGPLISLIKTLRHLQTFLRTHQLSWPCQPPIGDFSSWFFFILLGKVFIFPQIKKTFSVKTDTHSKIIGQLQNLLWWADEKSWRNRQTAKLALYISLDTTKVCLVDKIKPWKFLHWKLKYRGWLYVGPPGGDVITQGGLNTTRNAKKNQHLFKPGKWFNWSIHIWSKQVLDLTLVPTLPRKENFAWSEGQNIF